MPKRSDSVYLQDILEAIELIRVHLAFVSRRDFLGDQTLKDAVFYRLLVIGEATRSLSEGFHRRHPEGDWPLIIGLRNRIAHEYFNVDPDRIWDTVVRSLPVLEQQVRIWLNEEPEE